jgi:hypothetical protein
LKLGLSRIDPASERDGGASAKPSSRLPAPLACLPADLQAALSLICDAGRGPLGHRDTRSIFGDNLAILERLYRIGASHFDVSQILRDIGITRPSGEPLSVGTVSSAMSRARRAAAQERRRSGDRGRSRTGPRAIAPPGAARHGRAQQRSTASDAARPPHAAADPDGQAAPSRAADLSVGTSDRSDEGNPASQVAAPDFDAPVYPAMARAQLSEVDNSKHQGEAGG